MATIIRDKIKQPTGKDFKLLESIDVEYIYSDENGNSQITSVQEYLDELSDSIKNNVADFSKLDERYYTETEIDTKLLGLASTDDMEDLTERLNLLANSDDETLDQMKEVVDYIKTNKNLIDGVTTSKVNVADIVNNLETDEANKPLAAAQGVAIKELVDGLQAELDDWEEITSTEVDALFNANT